ncbi:MAG: cytochrome ubiquinol oxidase subunit I [Ilumatobacteraceae bacterium]
MVADQLMAARYQMSLSLGFHIVLSCVGVALPAMIFVAHRRGLNSGDPIALSLARRWSKVAAVLFAVGAVSGTILSFEMGLLWPGLMSQYGDVIGLPFALEGIAFFVEAIFIGIYLYGWDRLAPRTHLYTLIPMAVSGAFGTFCIIAVNSWMNAPSGFRLVDGKVVDVDPLAAIFNHALVMQFLHMFLAAYIVTGFLAAAVYAAGMLRGHHDHRHRLGFLIPFAFASIASVMQPLVGHVAGMRLATQQPEKLAAMDLAIETKRNAPLTIGGVLIDGRARGGIEVSGVGSVLARAGFDRPVRGIDDFAPADRPPVNIVHFSFQLMVGLGTLMALGSTLFWIRRRRGHDLFLSKLAMRLAVIAGPAAVFTLELGWITTEVGRQPWIVYRVLRVRDAVTDNNGVWISLATLVVVYSVMGVVAGRVLRSMTRRWRAGDGDDLPTPYGPVAE